MALALAIEEGDLFIVQKPNQMTNHMQIVFVAPFGLRQKSTVWARTLPLARQLCRHGHCVTILIPPWDSPVDAGQSWCDDGVRIVNVGLAGGLPCVLWRMWRQLQRCQPAVVHIVKPRAHAGLVQWLLWQRRRWAGGNPRIVLDIDDSGAGLG